MALRLDDGAAGFEAEFSRLVDRQRDQESDVRGQVEAIVARVAADGDAALIDFSWRFDRLRLEPSGLRIGDDEIERALRDCAGELRDGAGSGRAAASAPSTSARCRRTTISRTRRACGSGCAGGRSRRSGSTSRAGPRPIRARS